MTDLAFNDGGNGGTLHPLPVRARRVDVSSDAAKARVRRRYRSEFRFRLYGIAAVAFAALFLAILLFDIVSKALPAFTIHHLSLEAPVAAENLDTSNLAASNFDAMVRDGLRAVFPAITARADRKALDSLLSSGASDDLRAKVIAGGIASGSQIKVPALLSSDADLYLKGLATKRRESAGDSAATPSATTGAITITTLANSFAAEATALKAAMQETSTALTGQAARLATSILSSEADLKAANARLQAANGSGNTTATELLKADVTRVQATRDALTTQRDAALAIVSAIKARSETEGSAEVLDNKLPSLLIALNGGVVKVLKLEPNRIEGDVLVPLGSTAPSAVGDWTKIILDRPEDSRKVTDKEIGFLEILKTKGLVSKAFNWSFFTGGDSREPELAGILGALVGSLMTMFVTLVLCLPIGVMAAVYLEEFAPKNRLSRLIEVNINNLAAVPSIVFGLLGLAMFLNFFGMPRSSPLVGGLVLALLVLPTIIIASRAALRAVPPSIREAALGIGASKQQAIFHHVLPLAMPGIMTGAIIGMAHALGETAPLLMIGMIAFIVDVPGRVTEAATVLPVQIFLWSDLPELGFQAKTAAAIMVLLAFLLVMNGMAIWLRKKFERRW